MSTITNDVNLAKPWSGGDKPFSATYGKMMMWFFILSDALTFSGFLAAYGFMRFNFIDTWPIADTVFTHFPFVHGDYPLLYVALMTFILIMSSVTMVLAVDAGHRMKHQVVAWYLFATIIGGVIFLGSQAWEWNHFIHGSYGSVKLDDRSIAYVVDVAGKRVELGNLVEHHGVSSHGASEETHVQPSLEQIKSSFEHDHSLQLKLENKSILDNAASKEELNTAIKTVYGATLTENEYGKPLFANFFFFITGFHGFHVFSGVLFNVIIFVNTLLGTYRKRKSYEMVEKIGLYWHFVDLVWVFVFTFFYLV